MRLNLKKHSQDIASIMTLKNELKKDPKYKKWDKLLERVLDVYEHTEIELTLSGECILELDKSRRDAINERDFVIS